MEQYNIEVLVSGDIAKSKEILKLFVAQVITTNTVTTCYQTIGEGQFKKLI